MQRSVAPIIDSTRAFANKESQMKPQLRMGIAAIALLASAGVASAAGTMGTSNSSSPMPTASTSKAKDSLTLTKAQKKTIWQDVSKTDTSMKKPAGFTAQLGKAVPSSVKLHPLPTSVTNQIAKVRPYEYALLDNQTLLIVNPMDKKVVDIIRQT
jgi:hypothetical protein